MGVSCELRIGTVVLAQLRSWVHRRTFRLRKDLSVAFFEPSSDCTPGGVQFQWFTGVRLPASGAAA